MGRDFAADTCLVRRLLNTRALAAVVSFVAVSGIGTGIAQASDQLGYVTNEQAGTISQVDLSTGTLGLPISVGAQPVAVAINPSGSIAYVADYGSSQIVPVALSTGRVGPPIVLSDRPAAIGISANGKTAYVISDKGREWPITLATGHVGNPTSIPANSDAIAIAPAGSNGFITNVADGTLTAFNLTTGSIGQPINLSSATPDGVALSPDGATAYIVSNSGGTLTPLNLVTETSGTAIPLGTGSEPTSVAISADGGTAYVTDFGTGDIVPVTLSTGVLGTAIPVGPQPSAIGLVPPGGITAAPPSSGGTAGGGSLGTVTTTLGNQQLTVTISPAPGGGASSSNAQACHAASSTLKITVQRRTISHAAKLKLRYITFTLGKLVRRTTRFPAVARFPLRGLKRGTHSIRVRAFFAEAVARAGKRSSHKLTVTISRTLTSRFTVC